MRYLLCNWATAKWRQIRHWLWRSHVST